MISDAAEAVRFALYQTLAKSGVLPSNASLAAQASVGLDDLRVVIAELADAHHLALDDAGQIELAHPFAARNFGFSVMGPSTLWWGGCAWDAFAIPHLVPGSSRVLVASCCPACSTPHAWTVEKAAPPSGLEVAHFLVPMDQVWPNVSHACANQQIFCSEECVDEWLAERRLERGYVMDLPTLWRLSAHWYEGRLGTPYERREPSEAAQYFQSVGLRGPFWGLEPAEG